MTTCALDLARSAAPTDAAAVFEQIFARYHEWLRAMLARSTGNWHLAEDLTAEAFLILWREMERGFIPEDLDKLSGLLWVKARRAVGRHLSRAAVQRETPTDFDAQRASDLDAERPGEPASNPRAIEDTIADRELVDAALAALPAPQRRTVALLYLADYSRDQVAEATGLCPTTISRQASAGMAALRAAFGVQAGVDEVDVARRRRAARVFAEAARAGRPISHAALGRRFGRSTSWAQRAVAELAPETSFPAALGVAA